MFLPSIELAIVMMYSIYPTFFHLVNKCTQRNRRLLRREREREIFLRNLFQKLHSMVLPVSSVRQPAKRLKFRNAQAPCVLVQSSFTHKLTHVCLQTQAHIQSSYEQIPLLEWSNLVFIIAHWFYFILWKWMYDYLEISPQFASIGVNCCCCDAHYSYTQVDFYSIWYIECTKLISFWFGIEKFVIISRVVVHYIFLSVCVTLRNWNNNIQLAVVRQRKRWWGWWWWWWWHRLRFNVLIVEILRFGKRCMYLHSNEHTNATVKLHWEWANIKKCRAPIAILSMQFKWCIAFDLSPYPWCWRTSKMQGMEWNGIH